MLITEIEVLAGRARLKLTPDAMPIPEPAPAIVRLGLTKLELDVLEHLMAGDTNRQIAGSLFISIKTAGVHVSNILRKLARCRARSAGWSPADRLIDVMGSCRPRLPPACSPAARA